MTWIMQFAFCSVLFTLLMYYLLTKTWNAGSKTNKATIDSARVQRLHRQVDVLLETLGLEADETLPADVTKLVHEGRLIEAIKRYRELTGVGLKEAKDAVEGRDDLATVERKLARVLRELDVPPAVQETADPIGEAPAALVEIETLAAAGQIIPAVKRYKEMTGSSLLEAKVAVQQIQRQQRER